MICSGFYVFRQGETDAVKEDRAHTYYERFEALVTDVRGLGYPELKFFTVAVTGTTDRLPYLQQVSFCPPLLPNQFAALLFGMAVYSMFHLLSSVLLEPNREEPSS